MHTSIPVVERVGVFLVRRKIWIGESLEECHERSLLLRRQVQAERTGRLTGRGAQRWGEVRVIHHAGIIELHHLFQRCESSVVHVRAGKFDVAQRGRFEFSIVARISSDAANSQIYERKLQAIVIERRASREAIRAMTRDAGGARVADLSEEDLSPEIFLRREVREVVRDAGVVFGFGGDDGANELCERAADAVRSDSSRAEGGREKIRIERFGSEAIGEHVERHAHFHGVLDGLQHLIFEGVGAFVPEEMAALIPARVAQTHRVSPGQSTIEPDAERARIGETMFALMAGRTGNGLVCRKSFIVEQHTAQCCSRIRCEISCGRGVLSEDRIHQKRNRQNRCGVVERGGGQQERIRSRAQNVLLVGIVKSPEEKIGLGYISRERAGERAVVNLQCLDFRPGGEVAGALEHPDVIVGVSDFHAGDVCPRGSGDFQRRTRRRSNNRRE